jgi:hypothetical protein
MNFDFFTFGLSAMDAVIISNLAGWWMVGEKRVSTPDVKPDYSRGGYRLNPVDTAQGNDNGLIDKD